MGSPKISVLTPTRGRPERLAASIKSLHDRASTPGDVEYLFATDDDDAFALSLFTDVQDKTAGMCEVRSPRRGYGRMHEYYNALAAAAHPESLLLFNWNDDTEMLTEGWDRLILDGYDLKMPLVQFIRRDTLPKADDTFPFTDRRIYAAAGRLSGHCFSDTWVSQVAELAGVRAFRDDVCFHHHRLSDKTALECQAETRIVFHDFARTRPEREADSAKVRAMVERLRGQG